mmetsp:Transcript_23565/g.82057  ORF Transcript_23565/g.82057 Transcript_23565/m.82057 type:complete len:246 (+) Transcript_23565:315-1052(+)
MVRQALEHRLAGVAIRLLLAAVGLVAVRLVLGPLRSLGHVRAVVQLWAQQRHEVAVVGAAVARQLVHRRPLQRRRRLVVVPRVHALGRPARRADVRVAVVHLLSLRLLPLARARVGLGVSEHVAALHAGREGDALGRRARRRRRARHRAALLAPLLAVAAALIHRLRPRAAPVLAQRTTSGTLLLQVRGRQPRAPCLGRRLRRAAQPCSPQLRHLGLLRRLPRWRPLRRAPGAAGRARACRRARP